MSKIHLGILDTKRVNLLTRLSRFKTIGYLGGGTALALQIAHRRSVDFDVFIQKPVEASLRHQIKNSFTVVSISVDTSDQITFATEDGINVSFIHYYYKLVFPPVTTNFLPLASIADIAADKAVTIGRRAVWRDYVDIFFLLHEGFMTIEKIIDTAKKKFGTEFNELLFFQQLTYFEDMKVTPTEFIDQSFTAVYIQAFLKKQVETGLKKVII